MEPVEIVHYTDPACPWAYSAEPAFRALEWRYGDGLRWRTVLIGLSEELPAARSRPEALAARAHSRARFRARFGMPFAAVPTSRAIASGRACRAVCAARAQGPAPADALLRALRFAFATGAQLVDTDEGLAALAETVPGLDVDAMLAAIGSPAVEADYQAGRAEADAALPTAVAQGKTATRGERKRYTAPSLVLSRAGRTLVAAGWQGLEAYDVCVVNLAPDLARRSTPTPAELLPAYPHGLTTMEVAVVCTDPPAAVDRTAIEAQLIDLVAAGQAIRMPLGDDAIWMPAS